MYQSFSKCLMAHFVAVNEFRMYAEKGPMEWKYVQTHLNILQMLSVVEVENMRI